MMGLQHYAIVQGRAGGTRCVAVWAYGDDVAQPAEGETARDVTSRAGVILEHEHALAAAAGTLDWLADRGYRAAGNTVGLVPEALYTYAYAQLVGRVAPEPVALSASVLDGPCRRDPWATACDHEPACDPAPDNPGADSLPIADAPLCSYGVGGDPANGCDADALDGRDVCAEHAAALAASGDDAELYSDAEREPMHGDDADAVDAVGAELNVSAASAIAELMLDDAKLRGLPVLVGRAELVRLVADVAEYVRHDDANSRRPERMTREQIERMAGTLAVSRGILLPPAPTATVPL